MEEIKKRYPFDYGYNEFYEKPFKPVTMEEQPESFWITPYLRFKNKSIPIDEQIAKYELRLQQMWQGSKGSQKWEWVEEID